MLLKIWLLEMNLLMMMIIKKWPFWVTKKTCFNLAQIYACKIFFPQRDIYEFITDPTDPTDPNNNNNKKSSVKHEKKK